MHPAALIPTPEALPVAWGWFQLLLLPTFFLHILLMNVMFGAAFIALVSHLRAPADTTPCTAEISQKLPFTIAFAVNFGVAPLLFVQVLYGQYIYVSSLLMAVFWLSIMVLLIAAYSLAYVYKYRFAELAGWRVVVAGLITVCLLAIGFCFTNNLTLMQTPAAWSRYFAQPGGLLLNLVDPTFWPRYLHFMVSAVAIGGLALAAYFSWQHRRGMADAHPWIRYGCRWFGYATLVNLAIGLWFLLALPAGMLTLATGAGRFFLLLLTGGVVLALVAVRLGFSLRVMPALACALGTLALMIGARSLLRTMMLAPWFSLDQLPVVPAYGPMVLFFLFLAGGLVLIGWMVWSALRCPPAGEVRP
jgi:hypothetical protein